MSRAVRDAIVFALFGAVLGAFAATVVASAAVTVIGGGRIKDVGMFDILAHVRASAPRHRGRGPGRSGESRRPQSSPAVDEPRHSPLGDR